MLRVKDSDIDMFLWWKLPDFRQQDAFSEWGQWVLVLCHRTPVNLALKMVLRVLCWGKCPLKTQKISVYTAGSTRTYRISGSQFMKGRNNISADHIQIRRRSPRPPQSLSTTRVPSLKKKLAPNDVRLNTVLSTLWTMTVMSFVCPLPQ